MLAAGDFIFIKTRLSTVGDKQNAYRELLHFSTMPIASGHRGIIVAIHAMETLLFFAPFMPPNALRSQMTRASPDTMNSVFLQVFQNN